VIVTCRNDKMDVFFTVCFYNHNNIVRVILLLKFLLFLLIIIVMIIISSSRSIVTMTGLGMEGSLNSLNSLNSKLWDIIDNTVKEFLFHFFTLAMYVFKFSFPFYWCHVNCHFLFVKCSIIFHSIFACIMFMVHYTVIMMMMMIIIMIITAIIIIVYLEK